MRPHFPKRRSQDGFSLVELLVVIAIILLLAALSIPRLLDAQKTTYEAAAVSLLRTLQSDQESYRLANGSYADNFNDLGLAALVPASPNNLFTPDALPQMADGLLPLGSFSVQAAPSQQPPPPTPTPPPPPKQEFGADPGKKQPEKKPDVPGAAPSGGSGGAAPGTGSGGSGGSAGGTSTPTGGGAGSGSTSGGTSSGGAAGGGAPGQSGTGAPGGGSGGSFSPSPAPKTNILMKHTYIFTLLRPTLTTWTCSVVPIRDRGDSKFFFLDQTGVMRVELGKPASAKSPQM